MEVWKVANGRCGKLLMGVWQVADKMWQVADRDKLLMDC